MFRQLETLPANTRNCPSALGAAPRPKGVSTSLRDRPGYRVENLVGSIVRGLAWMGVRGAADIHEQVPCE